MEFSGIVVLVLALLLAVFEPGLSQQEGDDDLQVVTTQKALKKLIRKEIAKAFESVTVTCAATSAPTSAPTAGLDEHVIARIEEKIDAKFDSLEKKINTHYKLGSTPHHSANSCAEIIENNRCSLSGDYWIANQTGQPNRVYCDMTTSFGGFAGGWMRVAYLDMTNANHRCPSGLRQRTDFRACTGLSDGPHTCSPVRYTSHGIQYSRVYGKIIGHKSGSVDGFHGPSFPGPDSIYVDGVSLTHGGIPRKHIWTFAADRSCSGNTPPAFVNNDYFNDKVNPLWDGTNCDSNTNNPPWFHKKLPRPTTDDIEMRVCRSGTRSSEDVLIKAIEIYIK